jgi:hypothetical protein
VPDERDLRNHTVAWLATSGNARGGRTSISADTRFDSRADRLVGIHGDVGFA